MQVKKGKMTNIMIGGWFGASSGAIGRQYRKQSQVAQTRVTFFPIDCSTYWFINQFVNQALTCTTWRRRTCWLANKAVRYNKVQWGTARYSKVQEGTVRQKRTCIRASPPASFHLILQKAHWRCLTHCHCTITKQPLIQSKGQQCHGFRYDIFHDT